MRNYLEIKFDGNAELVVMNNGGHARRTILEKTSDICVEAFKDSTLSMTYT